MYAIEVQDVWKRYWLQDERPRTLKETVVSRFRQRRARKELLALQGVTLHIGWGRTVGIIGNNGAGKSTLLRLLSGLGRPTRGTIRHNGRMSTLLELGAGFNSELTGRANVLIGGLVSGLRRREVEARFAEIVDFAELWDFIDAPMRTYSSGMYVRLAFATAINLDPDIVIVDEVLAVGDLRYQRKCFNRLLDLKQSGKTIVVVSHDMGQIETLCDEVIWLDRGRVRAHGSAPDVIAQYKSRLFAAKQDAAPLPTYESAGTVPAVADTISNHSPTQAPGNAACRLTGVWLYSEDGMEIDSLESGEALQVEFSYIAPNPLGRPLFSVGIFQEDGTKCYEAVTEADGLYLDLVQGEGSLRLMFSELALMSGYYYIDVGVYAPNWEQTYDYRHKAANLTVHGATPGSGIFLAPHAWRIGTGSTQEPNESHRG